jgi:hypothetical protein
MAQADPRTTTTRRAILAGIATISTVAAPALALSGVEPDPIFAAIERHKVAFQISQEASRIRSGTVDAKWAPEYDPVKCRAAEEADIASTDASNDAAYALTTVRPTTMAGILALLRYVEAFNAGALSLEPLPGDSATDWHSAPFFWPESQDEHEIDLFGYAFLANVRSALEAMAVVS